MADKEEGKSVKAGEFETGRLYRTKKPFSSLEYDMDAHPRWLLYLGNSSSFDGKVFAYVFSSTTQLQHFVDGGDKENSAHRSYKKGTFGFTEDCIICFDDIIDYLSEDEIAEYEPELKGVFSLEELRNVYNCIRKSNKIKFIVKTDIHNNLGNIGIKGLLKPKRKKR